MPPADSPSSRCPRCRGSQLTLTGESIEYRPEAYAGQPLEERELRTIAYQCECGLAFTETGRKSGGAG